jgi:ABC-type transporter Mla maintaining outer membrane lipid asymmetry ATPase subunit MlaF
MTLTPEATMAAERALSVQPDVEPAVVLDEVTKVYGRSVVALDKLSLTVGRGEFVCLVGPRDAARARCSRSSPGSTRRRRDRSRRSAGTRR